MKRIPEPELMEGEKQGEIYAQANFSAPNALFIKLFKEKFPRFPSVSRTSRIPGQDRIGSRVLDLGCGPADILIRFIREYPDCSCIGIDGSDAMLALGYRVIEQEQLQQHIALHCQCLPFPEFLPYLRKEFQAVISNSLLHHLHRPEVLWQTVRRHTASGGAILIMDLFRPQSAEEAAQIVATYAADEPEILQMDFYNSLLAAFRLDEVREQLRQADLDLHCEQVSDRHLAVWGTQR